MASSTEVSASIVAETPPVAGREVSVEEKQSGRALVPLAWIAPEGSVVSASAATPAAQYGRRDAEGKAYVLDREVAGYRKEVLVGRMAPDGVLFEVESGNEERRRRRRLQGLSIRLTQ